MPKVLPVPHPIFILLYLLPLLIFGAITVFKLRTVAKEYRSSWLVGLSLVFSLAAITMSMMRINWGD